MKTESIGELWSQLILWIHKDTFWEKCNYFLQGFGNNYTEWDKYNQLEIHQKYENISDILPEARNEIVMDLMKLFNSEINYIVQKKELNHRIFHIVYLFYVLSFKPINKETFVQDEEMFSILYSIIKSILEQLEMNTSSNDHYLILFYLLSMFNNLISAKNCISRLIDEETISSLFIKFLNIVKSISFTKVEYITTLSLLILIVKTLQKNISSTKYNGTKIVKHLLYFIGNPKNIPNIYSLEDNECIFKLQMRALEAINMLIIYHNHFIHFIEEDGFDKMIDNVLWISMTSPYQTVRLDAILSLKNELYLDPPTWSAFRLPGSWSICNSNLKHFFDLLTDMCLNSLTIDIGESNNLKKNASLVSSVIEMTLNIFNDDKLDSEFNRKAREFSLRVPELQLNILSFFTSIVAQSNNSMVYCDLMWKVVENHKYFIYKLNNDHLNLNDEESAILTYLTSFLRGYIFQFIEYITYSFGRSDFVEYIYKLTKISIEREMFHHSVRSTGSILLISKLEKDLAVKASIKYGFTEIIRIIVNLSERLQSDDLCKTEKDYYSLSRLNLINILKNIDTTTDAREVLLRDYTIFDEVIALFLNYDMEVVKTFCIPFFIRQISMNIPSECYDTYSWIVLKFTDTLLKIVNRSTEKLILLIEAITEILRDDYNSDCNEVLKNIKERQNIFVKNGIFNKLIQIVETCNDDSMFKRNLSVLVIRSLTYLMKNNYNNKEIFKSSVGFNKLKDTLLKFHNNDLSNHKDLIIELIRMLFDGSRAIGLKSIQSGVWSFEITNDLSSELNTPTIPNISNPHVAEFILQLVPYFSREDQNIIFNAFNDIVKNSSVNATKISSIGALEMCIEILKSYKSVSEADSLFELITSLSSYNISARELKKLLNLFNPFEGDVRSQWTFNILKSLEKMIDNDKGPTHYFDFDGVQSSLKLPPFSRWPGEGFTLFTRIRVESFLHHCTNDRYYPRIFSFMNDEGEGCELLFDSHYLNFRLFIGNSLEEVYTFDFKFHEKEWYSISFSISSNNKIITKSTDLKLAVKSECDPFKYQKTTLNRSISLQNLNHCYIGTSHDVFKSHTDRLYYLHTFFGQISEIIIYEEDMNKGKMKSFLELSYISLDSRKKIFNTSQPTIIYSPYAVDTTYTSIDSEVVNESPICYDLSVNLRDSRILGDLDVVHRKHARHILSCISGGIYTLFPLLHLLDKHESSLHKSILEKSFSSNLITPLKSNQMNQQSTWKFGIKQTIEFEVGSNVLLEKILNIICNILLNSKELQYQIERTKGFSVLSYLLMKVSPLNLSANVLNIFVNLLRESSFSNNLKEDIVRYIFLEFYIWVYSPFKVQKYLLRKVIPYSLELVKNSHNIVTVNSILENIQLYYWTVPSQNVLASDHIVHPVTKRVISQRPTLDELSVLRKDAYKIIRYLMKDKIKFDDTRAIIQFFINCNDPVLIDEIVDYIKELSKNHPEFNQHLNQLNFNILSLPLESKIHSIRANTLSLMFHFHNYNKEYPLLYQSLKIHGNDLRILRTLLQVSLGYYYKKESSNTFIIDSNMKIIHDNIIPVILKLSIDNTNNEHKLDIISSLKNLIQVNVHNRNIISSIHYIDMYLLSFYMKAFKSLPTKETTKIKQTVIEIMTILTHHNLKFSKNILSFLDNHIYSCQAACTYYTVSCYEEYFIQYIKLLLDPIYYELKLISMNETNELDILEHIYTKDSYTLTNIFQILVFVSEFISTFIKYDDEEGYKIPSSFIDSGLLLIYMDILHIIEKLHIFNHLVLNCPLSIDYSMKKGVIRYSNDISLILKICIIQIYNQNDPIPINRCIECMKSRLSSKNVKKDEILYTIYHCLNALLIASSSFINRKKKSDIDDNKIKWANEQYSLICLMFKDLYSLFKRTLSDSKGFSNENINFIKEFTQSKKYKDISSHKEGIESFLSVLSSKLSDILKSDKNGVNCYQNIQKNGKIFFDKFIQYEIYENEKYRQVKEKVEQSFETFFDPHDSSITKTTENFLRLDHRWRNIVRTLRGEKGAWSQDQIKTYWKLDTSENSQRMRLKFVKNHNFKDYRDALKRKENIPSKSSIDMINKINVTNDLFRNSGRPDLGIVINNYENNVKFLEENDQNVRINENMIFVIDCEIIKPLNVISGVLEITNQALYFKEVNDDTKTLKKEKTWSIDQIRMMFIRRYVLKYTALEIFLTNQTSYFLNFKSADPRLVYLKIKRLNPPNLIKEYTKEECLQKWVQGQMSNFEYLMCLNTLAGRTYNDISQYPVFPWIIMDMESKTIDLNDPRIYRDLSKPVGALNDKRLARFTELYENLPETNRFFYGSHYSSAAIVLFYLMRIEPFTSLYVKLNDNSFDHPDRMFYSIRQTLKNCLSSSGDVKELIPEFFYLPEMFKNMNKFNFGCKQDGTIVDDVELPPWAKTPEEFVRIHRQALESEYVSKNLHNWIDLIFGYKQRGDAAISSFNLFHYMSYEGVVDIEKIEDSLQREAAISMIKEFGQTPIQLFTEPHPKREVFHIEDEIFQPYQPKSVKVSSSRIIWIDINSKKDEIICIDSLGRQYALQKSYILGESNIKTKRDPIIQFEEPRLILPHMNQQCKAFSLSSDRQIFIAPLLETPGLILINLESRKRQQTITIHKDLVTATSLTEDSSILITGSKDTTLQVWNIEFKNGVSYICDYPISTLYGHVDTITHISSNKDLGICLSLSQDNTLIVHNLKDFSYIRDIQIDDIIDIGLLSSKGYIIVYTKTNILYLYSINGHYLTKIEASENPTCMVISYNGEYIITGGNYSINIRRIYDFKTIRRIYVDSIVRSISSDNQHIVAGLEDGRVLLVGLNLNSQ